jgi:hypothetical protein
MSDDLTSTNAKHIATKQGNADHGGYASGIMITFFLSALALICVMVVGSSIPTERDVWQYMRTCPPTYTRILDDRGQLKDCILTDTLATPIATPTR